MSYYAPSFGFDLEALLRAMPEIESNKNYWLVRTEGGEYYKSFVNHGFIGIGWDKITVKDIILNEENPHRLSSLVAGAYSIDRSKTAGKREATSIANKLSRFTHGMNRGDFVVIPNYGAHRLAFGIIVDDHAYTEESISDGYPHKKRRKVKWVSEKAIADLDPVFYKVTRTWHAISSVKKYAHHIDKQIKLFYRKGDSAFLIIPVKTKKSVSAITLFETWLTLLDVTEDLASDLLIDFDKKKVKAKISVQSPGDVELLSREAAQSIMSAPPEFAPSALIILLISLTFYFVIGSDGFKFKIGQATFEGGKTGGLLAHIKDFINSRSRKETIDWLKNNFNELEVDKEKLLESINELAKEKGSDKADAKED